MIERGRLEGECGYHGDEHRAGRIEFELGVFEDETLLMAGDGTLNQLDLLSHDGQDFQFDTIESRRRWLALKRNTSALNSLVETSPGTRLRQALEELRHGFVIQTVGAVEDDALFGNRLGQILCGLGFSCTGGSFRCTTEIQLQSAHQCPKGDEGATKISPSLLPIASIGQRRDDQTRRIAQILVGILQFRG